MSKRVGYDHPIELPLQRSSMFFPGVRVVLWPRRRKRPLSKTWVNKVWPFPPPPFSLGCGCGIFSLFRMRFSPMSFLLLTCWQAPGYTEAQRKEGRLEGKEHKYYKDKSQSHQLLYYGSILHRNSVQYVHLESYSSCFSAVTTVQQEV